MKRIAFVETEADEQEWLAANLRDCELRFASSLEAGVDDAEVVSVFLNSPIDLAFLDAHPALELITTRSTTFDHIDVAECARRGVVACNVPTYGEYTVAEHTFALILGLARRLREAMDSGKSSAFSYENVRGTELRGKTLGIVGAGRVGQHVIRMARAFELRVIVDDVERQPGLAAALDFEYVEFDDLLARSDIISLHAALTPANYHLFNRDTFAKCRRGALIVNTARGRLIDTDALREALDSGIVAGAGLDVLEDERVMRREPSKIIRDQIVEHLHANFAPRELRPADNTRVQELQTLVQNHQLLTRPNVLFTPHIAFNSAEAIERILQTTVDNIRAFVAGAPINVLSASDTMRG